MKKCLCCENQIEKLNHYVCSECYLKIKDLKNQYKIMNEKELKSEFTRWLRNKNFTRNTKYQNEYQLKIISIAEIFKDKYNDSSRINKIIDFSNKQEIKDETIKINEEEAEEEYNKAAADKDVKFELIKTYKKCKDGHRVISISEKTIDDWLTDHEIRHYYDIEIDDNTNFRYDFYLPDYKIFIEFWGLNDDKYLARRKAKEEYYNKNYKNQLLSIEPENLSDLNKFLINELKKFKINISKK